MFLKLDFNVKEPTFTISNDEDEIFKGKIDVAIIEKLKMDEINFITNKYIFSIKTIYKPETTVNAENVQHFLLSYKSIDK